MRKVGDDDPAALVIWDDDNVDFNVAAFSVAINRGAVLPPWLAAPIARKGLKVSILQHVRGIACGNETEVVGNALIGPNTLVKFARITQLLHSISDIQLFCDHAVCPIGHLHVIADRRAKTTAFAAPLAAPPNTDDWRSFLKTMNA